MTAGALSFAGMNALAHVLRHLPWPLVACTRAVFGLVGALAVAQWRGASLAITDRSTMCRRSLAGSISMLLTFYALTHMPLADATALFNTTPVWITVLAWLTLREAPSLRAALALALALLGVLLVERPTFSSNALAGAAALGASGMSAVAMVSLRRLSGESPEAVVVHFSTVASMVLAMATAAWRMQYGPLPAVSAGDVLDLVAIGLLATVGQLAMTRAYALDKAGRVGSAGQVQLVFAVGIDALVFGRWPTSAAGVGIALILSAGVLLVDDARRETSARDLRDHRPVPCRTRN
jgi:drug/metabolite transporter (DMT)-like permease